MSMEQLKGNDKLIERMKGSIQNDTVAHAYVFEGDSAVDKKLAAELFVKAIFCENNKKLAGDSCDHCDSCRKIAHGNHENIYYVQKEGNHIKDETIEELQTQLKKKPYSGDRTAVIIEDADTMTLRAQNRLLKTLEEPPLGTVILLLSENIENLVETIRSRCIIYRFGLWQTELFEEALLKARMVETMFLNKKPFYEITQVIPTQVDGLEAAQLFLDTLESWYRDIAVSDFDQQDRLVVYREYADELRQKSKLYKKEKIYETIAHIEEAKRNLNRNINIGYTLKNMVLKIGG